MGCLIRSRKARIKNQLKIMRFNCYSKSPLLSCTLSQKLRSGNWIKLLVNKRFQSIVSENQKLLSMNNVNPCMREIEYAVRGPIVQLASKLQDEINKGSTKPYNRVIRANIGDAQAMGQRPLTFLRQVIAACSNPDLLKVPGLFPEDVEDRARQIIRSAHGSIGCYSDSLGCALIRKQVAQYIQERDGFSCDYSNVFLTNGASSAIKMVLYSLMTNENGKGKAGIMLPIPQYPLYSASISEIGGHTIKYYLDETNNWALNLCELEKAYERECESCTPRAIVVINPGNPTGQILPYENIVEIITFARDHKLLLLADEVYQQNLNDSNAEFHSFKKVLCELGQSYSNVELISFHSASKGFYGECGLRGGYMELFRIDEDIKDQYTKLMSTNLGSNLPGQIAVSCIVAPPEVGDESYKLYVKERTFILDDLQKKAQKVYKSLNQIEGITCNPVQGALYAFPRLHLSDSAISAAKEAAMEPDTFYCTQLLLEKGICVVPGSGFQQVPGTYHFRMTILPSKNDIKYMMEAIGDFNAKFRSIYS